MNLEQKIAVVLKEYETLRAEILQRTGHRFTILSLGGALGAYGVFSAEKLTKFQLSVLVLSALALIGVWFQLGKLIARCSARISEIEISVNDLADETLLRWEHEKRGSSAFHKIHK